MHPHASELVLLTQLVCEQSSWDGGSDACVFLCISVSQPVCEQPLLEKLSAGEVERLHACCWPVGTRVDSVCLWLGVLQTDDQGLVNTDPRTIAVPNGWVNMIPTDVRGLTFDRTPQQLLNILFLGNPAAKGVFFPNGVMGAINKPAGYNATASGLDSFPASGAKVAMQVCDA